MIIDGMMHLEVVGHHWDGLLEEILRLYDAAGIDKGVAMTTWMPSGESNEHTRRACRQYPDRFIPFGHVRPQDDWRSELRRITQELGWTGLKLHQGELKAGGPDLRATASEIVRYAAGWGVKLVKIHLSDYAAVDALAQEQPEVTWILPHMGCYFQGREMQRYCELARARPNVYLDTSAADRYYDLDRAVRWAGPDKITFASDGHLFSPLVEKAKIDTLRYSSPHRQPLLTDEEYAMIMGGTMARLLGLSKVV
jgi:predicted TIM-barrel fold metal-dependent hydrolase